MKSIGLQAITMAVAASFASGVAAGGSLAGPFAQAGVSHGNWHLNQAAVPAASPYSYGRESGIGSAGPVNNTAYRPSGDGDGDGDAGAAGFAPRRTASRPPDGPPPAFIEVGSDFIPVSEVFGSVLWAAAAVSNPNRSRFIPMAKHRPHAVPYSGEIDARGFGWR
jgi:hypothetical protein